MKIKLLGKLLAVSPFRRITRSFVSSILFVLHSARNLPSFYLIRNSLTMIIAIQVELVEPYHESLED
jgi:hypothetical protein